MEPPSTPRVTVLNETSSRGLAAGIRRAVATVLTLHGQPSATVCVLLGDDERIRDLNRTYRNVDEPTDVLSFAAPEVPGGPLGDIAISVPYAQRQAAARNVPLKVEAAYLAIHGALHLLGFDDETEGDRAEMFAEMHRMGIAAGLPPETEWTSVLHEVPA
ncbi:MAG: rRNA maturation RNase YbeY [Fimbriimonadales bacterium]